MSKNKKTFLSSRVKAIIFGSLLGDGSLRIDKNYKNARFSFRHSLSQKDYFFWKVNEMKEIIPDKGVHFQEKDGFQKKGGKLIFQSKATEALTEIYHLTHRRNQLVIRRKWLNLMTPLSLMVWWLDNGSIIGNGRRGVFCTDKFSLKEQKILKRYLSKVWNVKTNIGRISRLHQGKKKDYYRLWIRSAKELQKFLEIILPEMKIESMLSKVLLLYHESELQQRWISKVSQMTGFSREIVEKYVKEKKKGWERFKAD